MKRINSLLGIGDSYQAPERITEALLLWEKEKRDRLFSNFMTEFKYDVSYDWFHEYFLNEHADRKTKKQDFTPNTISALVARLVVATGIIHEPAAGTGGMLITAWHAERIKRSALDFDPLDMFFIAEELSDRAIPFLLFNLAIRGMHANVLHCNSLTRECKNIYHVHNKRNWHLDFSEINALPHSATVERAFNVKFIKGAK